ncbi:MAG: [FeFe] hydrogenase H-cluster maturation GTPase HydF [Bacteroides sp.]|nr:[FeFe] hydrogenase H-cluster maturation GTPase HydF [Bacteroides sp.]
MNNIVQIERLHIGIFGKCNSGKSSLLNAITGQYTAVVSEIAGTTTDLVSKRMEIPGVGACLLMDTAGFDDTSMLRRERLEQTKKAIEKTDIALIICKGNDITEEVCWMEMFVQQKVAVIAVLNICEQRSDTQVLLDYIQQKAGLDAVAVNARTGEGIKDLIAIIRKINQQTQKGNTITGNLVKAGDVVMLVMPQDQQAPVGRLILPQAQTIRELLDKNCIIVSCIPELMDKTLASLVTPPELIITDSQVFEYVYQRLPEESKLTSFSVLFAQYKGNIKKFIEGAHAIDKLTEDSHVLIAEACTHAPLGEDIGRVKIPQMLRQRVGQKLSVDVVSGSDFPRYLNSYDLIIHCGACMFNRKHVLSRIEKAEGQKVAITNYGIAIAYLKGILGRVVYPEC